MVDAICQELILRKHEAQGSVLQTVYFGGGTPSLLSQDELAIIMKTIFENYQVSSEAEITLEANPDDFFSEKYSVSEKLENLKSLKINRLSIGIQSFFDEDLQLMNRAHTASHSHQLLSEVGKYFDNFTIDLIYGIPEMSVERWQENLHRGLSYGLPHISAYALTVEPKTALYKFIATGKVPKIDEDIAYQHFTTMIQLLEQNGYEHYELSNFGKKGFFSKNNTAYWTGKKYIGIGPSAHSFNGNERSWNISNNALYIKNITENILPSEKEILTPTDRYNELVMTGIRTRIGIDSQTITDSLGQKYTAHLRRQATKYIAQNLLTWEGNYLTATPQGKFLTDGIASDLFWTEA